MSDSANVPSPADPNALSQALLMTQQSLAALQRMQEQTAALHKQFLDTQEAAQRTLQTLVDQQQSLLLSGLGAGIALPTGAVPAPVPAPKPVPPPAPVREPAAPPPTKILPASALHIDRLWPRWHRPFRPRHPRFKTRRAAKPAPKAAPAAPPAPTTDRVAHMLLAVVSEKTGYPVDSLDLSLSLDADLGVDSIKRVEILSTLQERLPDAPVVKPEHLGTLRTLHDVAAFLAGERAPTGDDPHTLDRRRGFADDGEDVLLRTMPVSARAERQLLRSSIDVAQTLLAVVSEKTGYPVDSLDLSLSLDADLGVDSIKRVEILSALQEKLPDAPVVKPEHLGTLHTLKDVAAFLAGESPPATTKIPLLGASETLLTKPLAPQVAVTPRTTEGPNGQDTVQLSSKEVPKITDSIAEAAKGKGTAAPPRAPVEALRQPVGPYGDRVDRSTLQVADLDTSVPRSHVPLPGGAEFWVIGESDPLTEAVAGLLTAQGFAARVREWGGAGAAKAPSGPLAGLLLIAPVSPGADSGLNRRAFDWLKCAAAKLRQTGRASAAVFATVARLDGAFGLADLSADADPTAGGLAGLVKTARHEWPEVSCKAIDLAPTVSDPTAAALAVVDELLAAGPTEVGIAASHRCALELARTARRPNAQLINLGARDVILVTGGARGVTSEVAVTLAETYCPTLILTGRTPPPGPGAGVPRGGHGRTGDESGYRRGAGRRRHPSRAVGDLYKKVHAQREVQRTIERIQEAGAKVAYYPVDITNGKAVADLLHQVRVKFGPVTALVHGAGVLADKRIEDLTGEQFDYVYSTKVDGLRALLDLLAHEDLKALVLFSSTTARLGRTGQLAYACANEVLNKTAQVEARRRPGTRVVAINWGPWDGGMVTPGLRKVFEAEGVGVIPLIDGSMFLIQELNAAGRAVEVIALAKPPGRRGHRGPVSCPSRAAPPLHRRSGCRPRPVMSPPNPLPSADLALAFERVVDVATHPVLKSHVLDGLAVLPVALHLEWLAHAAMHGGPGLQFHGFNDLRVTTGLKIEAGGQVPLRALAGKPVKQDKLFLVPVELRGKHKNGRELMYSRAEIVLAQALPKPPPADAPPAVSPVPFDVARAYREFLFHGPDLHGIAELVGRAPRAFIARAYPAPSPADWFEFPLRSGWVADPSVLDAAFQMMILWTQSEHNTGSLPSFIGRYRQFRKSYPDRPDHRGRARHPRRRQVRPRRHRLPRPGRPGRRPDAGLRVHDGAQPQRLVPQEPAYQVVKSLKS